MSIDIRITVRSKPKKGKSAIIALIEKMLRDNGFTNVIIDDASPAQRGRLPKTFEGGRRDKLLQSCIAVDQEQTPRSQDT